MSSEQSSNECWLDQLKVHLKQQRYSPQSTRRRIAAAQRFVDYLDQQHIVVETVDLSNVNLYLHNELQLFQQNRQRAPRSSMTDWRRTHTAGIDMLLRLVHGQWPPAPAPSTPSEVFHRDLCGQYDEWMRDLRGLASETRSSCCAEAHRFLAWMGDDGSTQQSLLGITIVNVDAYMTFRAKSQRRSSLRSLAANLRSFLRYLNATGRTKDDLSTTVIGPTLYAFESIPSVVRPEDIKMVVEKTRQDHSKRGRRDYAILMLLSSYGLRAGEITSLRLDDVDWQGDVLRIHHSKTGAHSELPLFARCGKRHPGLSPEGPSKDRGARDFHCGSRPISPLSVRLLFILARSQPANSRWR